MSTMVKIKDIVRFANLPLADKKFTPKMNLAIAANAAAIEPHLKGYDEANRKLLDDFMEKDEDGNPITIEHEGQTLYKFKDSAAYEKAYEEMVEQEVELNIIKFKASEVEKCDGENMDIPTVAEMTIMMFMVDL